jgi:hypothetical protein
VVSGLPDGIDAVAHRGALGVNGLKVVFGSEDDVDLVMIEMDQMKKKLLTCQDKKKSPVLSFRKRGI